jgi:REP element-mobilizing transposase RayT
MPALAASARERLTGPAVTVNRAQAKALLAQFQETATHRGWLLHAVAVMFNHVHLIVEAPRDVGKPTLLRDFKSYAARRLNREFGRPASGTWWTHGGSCRVVDNVPSAVNYVCERQPHPLVVWSRASGG